MKKIIKVGIILWVSLGLTSSGWGVSPSIWKQKTQSDFEKGELKNVSVNSEGKVILAPSVDLIYDTGEQFVWDIVEDSKGNLFVGTGNNGKIFKIKKDGETTLFYNGEESQILSLALDEEDNLYAGTAPHGIIFKITPQGEAKILFDTPEQYVWDLIWKEGTLFAATGNKAKIYKIEEGKMKILYDCPEAHLICLAFDRKGNLYAGSEGNGIIYKIDDRGDVIALYDSPRREVHSIVVDEKDNLYIGTTGGLIKFTEVKEKKEPPGKEREKEKPLIYKITEEGVVSEIWSSPSEDLLSLIINKKGSLIVGTGKEGKIYEVTPKGESAFLTKCAESHILRFYKSNKNKIFFTTGNAGKVYKMSINFAKKGRLESTVYDATSLSKWGRISWDAFVPQKTKIVFKTRTGNSERPDNSWSEWSGEYLYPQEIKSPPARFIQWQAILSTYKRKVSPILKKVSLSYLQRNLCPKISSLDITFSEKKNQGKELDKGQIKVWWEAEDANGDELQYDIFFKGVNETTWKLLVEKLTESSYVFDSFGFPDETYQLKVIAGDIISNPQSTALSYEKVSDPFDIDNTLPKVKNLKSEFLEEGKYKIKGIVEDEMSIIVRIEYCIDAGDWQLIYPIDEVYDSKKEEFSFLTSSLSKGEHCIVIKVTDEVGNVGAGKLLLH